jgi:hypothetical protein
MTDIEFESIYEQIAEFSLLTTEHYKTLSKEEIKEEYNGIGPEWMPKKCRDWLTDHFEYFAPATVVHDIDYGDSDKTKIGFTAANERLRTNCKLLLKAKGCQWYKIWLYKYRVNEIADACQEFGWSAWSEI